MGREELKITAKQLRSTGMTYVDIGKQLGVQWWTARRWADDKAEAYDRNRRENGRSRIVQLLGIGRHTAKRRGFKPCSSSADEIYASMTDCCEMCGCNESQLKERLRLDHNHDTGKFRGWLCDSCNKSLGHFEKIKDTAEKYLSEHD